MRMPALRVAANQFDPREIAGAKAKVELHNADGKLTSDDHGGKVWVSKVIPGRRPP